MAAWSKFSVVVWLIKQMLKRSGVPPRPFVFKAIYSDHWFMIDHYGRIWRIRYTGAHDGPPFVIELV